MGDQGEEMIFRTNETRETYQLILIYAPSFDIDSNAHT